MNTNSCKTLMGSVYMNIDISTFIILFKFKMGVAAISFHHPRIENPDYYLSCSPDGQL